MVPTYQRAFPMTEMNLPTRVACVCALLVSWAVVIGLPVLAMNKPVPKAKAAPVLYVQR